eukprot:9178830-Alexandrium_andersonii.AAC.1
MPSRVAYLMKLPVAWPFAELSSQRDTLWSPPDFPSLGGRKCTSANVPNRFRQVQPCPKLPQAVSGSFGQFRALSG